MVVCVNRGGCASVTQDKKGKGRLIFGGGCCCAVGKALRKREVGGK